MPTLIVLALLALAAVAYGLWKLAKRRARSALLASPLTEAQREVIAAKVPITRRLPEPLARALEGRINLFLDQVEFIGRGGLEVTEEMRLSIAAQACLLVVNTDTWFINLRTVLIYPGAFKSRRQSHNGFVVTEHETVRTGESWARGPVILSWAHSDAGAADDADGQNVVIHEFAHQIDDLSGRADGAPILGRDQSFAEWARVFTSAYERLCTRTERGERGVIDPYGCEGHEEFFAVAVEVFFEQPRALMAEEPEVYAQLSTLFELDPVEWR
ncbi:zinc-dependent peptidase [Oceanicola sp. D3]|uniref:M90 family metallopeptidase n=1 Tax=Oceanicola sp. D3 TaxID=2587163 RepID=UPI0011225142|nr:M90 family metallopeptidase [Oceanicola sp. D3]QDC08385.1 zinc-dependent peptidase [Oceanicola sp. D3]